MEWGEREWGLNFSIVSHPHANPQHTLHPHCFMGVEFFPLSFSPLFCTHMVPPSSPPTHIDSWGWSFPLYPTSPYPREKTNWVEWGEIMWKPLTFPHSPPLSHPSLMGKLIKWGGGRQWGIYFSFPHCVTPSHPMSFPMRDHISSLSPQTPPNKFSHKGG